MVAQEACDALAEEAPLDPENVQLARFSRALPRAGAGVTAGAGLARTRLAPKAARSKAEDVIILSTSTNRKRNLADGTRGSRYDMSWLGHLLEAWRIEPHFYNHDDPILTFPCYGIV